MKEDLELADSAPEITERLIETLEANYGLPEDALPTPDSQERVDLYHAGQQSVIAWLKWVRLQQLERRDANPSI